MSGSIISQAGGLSGSRISKCDDEVSWWSIRQLHRYLSDQAGLGRDLRNCCTTGEAEVGRLSTPGAVVVAHAPPL